ncbi:MAG: helix-turn-helix domain-containing protein [Actinobacteria bacterium]|nr:helix-turn-helix domain-containing protein [Actinomycetota bacterium]
MTESAQTLDRGLRVLAALAESPQGLSAAEIAEQLGVARPIVYRLLTTLQAHGLARRAADRRFRLGLAVLALARNVQPLLRDVALPVLRTLAGRVGATAHLTVADGDEALAVAVVEPSWTDYHVGYRVGSRHPLGLGAAGRAIAADPTGSDRNDWVVTTGELQPGAHGVAAPVRGVTGLRASVGVVALGTLDPAVVGPRVVAAADQIAAALR